jgi:iron complex transport system substrate-binding protein
MLGAVRDSVRGTAVGTVLGTVVAAGLVVGLASSCGAPAGTAARPGDRGRTLAQTTIAADPHALTGPATAVRADSAVDPVADAPEPALPVTVTDAQGVAVTVTDASRVLALDLYGTLSRTVVELGLGDRLVARDASSAFPEVADLPVVTGEGHRLDGEAILALDPTVVLTDTSLGPWDVMLQLRDAGIPVVAVESRRSLESVETITAQVAAALGVPDVGAALVARTQTQVADVTARIDAAVSDDRRLRVVLLYVRGQAGVYYLFGQGSGADSLIRALDAQDVATEIGWTGMRPVSDEGIVAAAPDAILVMSDGLASVGGVDGLLERLPAIAATPAGEHRRVVDMADDQLLSFGPDVAGTLEALAVALYGEPA